MNRTCKVIGCFLFLGAMSSFGENIHSGRENEGQERPVAGSTSDPREEKGDRYFKSFESLEGDKSKNPSFDVGFVMGGGKTNRCGYRDWETRAYRDWETDRKSTRLNSSHLKLSRMPSSA